MKLFLLTFLNGLTLAGLYFLVASGFTLVFGLMRNVNLAHGSLYLLGAYIGYEIGDRTGSWLLAIVAGSLAAALFGVLLQVLVFRRMEGQELRQTLKDQGDRAGPAIEDLCNQYGRNTLPEIQGAVKRMLKRSAAGLKLQDKVKCDLMSLALASAVTGKTPELSAIKDTAAPRSLLKKYIDGSATLKGLPNLFKQKGR